MPDLVTMMSLSCLSLQATATLAGRELTAEDYEAEFKKVWDEWIEASITRDMTRAGFVKTAAGWQKPRPWWRIW